MTGCTQAVLQTGTLDSLPRLSLICTHLSIIVREYAVNIMMMISLHEIQTLLRKRDEIKYEFLFEALRVLRHQPWNHNIPLLAGDLSWMPSFHSLYKKMQRKKRPSTFYRLAYWHKAAISLLKFNNRKSSSRLQPNNTEWFLIASNPILWINWEWFHIKSLPLSCPWI